MAEVDWTPPVPYIVIRRQRSLYAHRFGARAWYEYPATKRKAEELKHFADDLLGAATAGRIPWSFYLFAAGLPR